MLHELIDLFALVVALLGLIPLWRDQRRRFLAAGMACLLLVAAGYLTFDYFAKRSEQATEELQANQELAEAESAILSIVCIHPDGMGFDEIYAHHVDYGSQTWGLTDQAFGDLVKKGLLAIDTKSIPSWDKKRTVPLRVWSVTGLQSCSTH